MESVALSDHESCMHSFSGGVHCARLGHRLATAAAGAVREEDLLRGGLQILSGRWKVVQRHQVVSLGLAGALKL